MLVKSRFQPDMPIGAETQYNTARSATSNQKANQHTDAHNIYLSTSLFHIQNPGLFGPVQLRSQPKILLWTYLRQEHNYGSFYKFAGEKSRVF